MKNLVGMKSVSYNDPYKIRDCSKDAFDYVIDIGSNVGQFSLISRILFPNAKIFAYEPCEKTYQILCENMDGFSDLVLVNKALGYGYPLYFKKSRGFSETCTGHSFKSYNTGGYKVDGISVSDIFEENEIDVQKNVLFKMDCEGGEQCLLGDEYGCSLLQQCKQVSFEIHYSYKNNVDFKDCPDWDTYNEWVQSTFKKTHNILYHRGNRNRGVGIYILTRRFC